MVGRSSCSSPTMTNMSPPPSRKRWSSLPAPPARPGTTTPATSWTRRQRRIGHVARGTSRHQMTGPTRVGPNLPQSGACCNLHPRGSRRILPDPVVRIVHGTAFELLAELGAFQSGPARASLESGKPWNPGGPTAGWARAHQQGSAHTLDTYANVATLAIESGDEVAVADLLARLRTMPPGRVRRRVIGADADMHRAALDDETIERAASGDARARSRVHEVMGTNGATRRSVDRLLRATAVGLPARPRRDPGGLARIESSRAGARTRWPRSRGMWPRRPSS